jgi:hypothetical protein
MRDPRGAGAHFAWGGLGVDLPVQGSHGGGYSSGIRTTIKAAEIEEKHFSSRIPRRRLGRAFGKYVAQDQAPDIVWNRLGARCCPDR